jgi:hypothetical protein
VGTTLLSQSIISEKETKMKFKKKPVVIEAIQWDGTKSGKNRITDSFPLLLTTAQSCSLYGDEMQGWSIDTLEGSHIVSRNDWIIKGIKGEFYPCKPDIFEMTYDTVQEE